MANSISKVKIDDLANKIYSEKIAKEKPTTLTEFMGVWDRSLHEAQVILSTKPKAIYVETWDHAEWMAWQKRIIASEYSG